ncbi:MAG: hypothetical protein ACFFBD_05880 [Candidatus Hodarchaeota archaeon]
MTWKLICPNNHEWVSPKNKGKCPTCGQRNQQAIRGRLIAYEIICEDCNISSRFERKQGLCPRCNKLTTRSKPIYDFK